MPARTPHAAYDYSIEKKLGMIFGPLIIIAGASSLTDSAMSEQSSMDKCIALNRTFAQAVESYSVLLSADLSPSQASDKISVYLHSTDNGGFLPWGGDYYTINVPVLKAE